MQISKSFPAHLPNQFRAGLTASKLAGITAFCSVVAICMAPFSNFEQKNRWIETWATWMMNALGVKVHVKGKENIPALRTAGCIYLFNHLSLMDIPLLYVAIGGNFRFGAKVELFNVPIFGAAIKAFGFLPIPRHNRVQAIRVYEKAKLRAQKGECFMLAPEGTRQSTLQLAQFKSGPFILAIQAGIPIVPVVIAGPEKIFPKGKLLPQLENVRDLYVEILPSVATEGLSTNNKADMSKKIHHIMDQALIPYRT